MGPIHLIDRVQAGGVLNSHICLQKPSKTVKGKTFKYMRFLHSVPSAGKLQRAIRAVSLYVTLRGRLKFPTYHIFREYTSVSLEWCEMGWMCVPHILESLHSLNAICLSETVSFCRLWIINVLLGFLKHIAGRLTCPRPWVGIKSMSGFTVFQQIQPHDKIF